MCVHCVVALDFVVVLLCLCVWGVVCVCVCVYVCMCFIVFNCCPVTVFRLVLEDRPSVGFFSNLLIDEHCFVASDSFVFVLCLCAWVWWVNVCLYVCMSVFVSLYLIAGLEPHADFYLKTGLRPVSFQIVLSTSIVL